VSLFLLIAFWGNAQNSNFKDEVASIKKKYDTLWDASKPTIVFTGSSSIRLWKDLESRFPEHQIVNTGFGGSETSDLLTHIHDLVLRYKPQKVFIYEGDNDISNGKRPKEIIQAFEKVISKIQDANRNTRLVIISPKPSITRWKHRSKYKRLNRKLKTLADEDEQIAFSDVWHVMLKGRKLNKQLFSNDGLHMNRAGYELWYTQIKKHLN